MSILGITSSSFSPPSRTFLHPIERPYLNKGIIMDLEPDNIPTPSGGGCSCCSSIDTTGPLPPAIASAPATPAAEPQPDNGLSCADSCCNSDEDDNSSCAGDCCDDQHSERNVKENVEKVEDSPGCNGCCSKADSPSTKPADAEREDANVATVTTAATEECKDCGSCCGDVMDEESELDEKVGMADNEGDDDDDDDSLCPCCVKIVIQNGGATPKELRRTGTSTKTLDGLTRTIRKCCRVLESVCAGKPCCFVPLKPKKSTSDFPVPSSNCKQPKIEEPIPEPTEISRAIGTERLVLEISGMDCVDCLPKVSRALSRLPSVKPLELDFLGGISSLVYDPEDITQEGIAHYVARATGFGVKPIGVGDPGGRLTLPITLNPEYPTSREVLERYDITDHGTYRSVTFSVQGDKARRPRDVIAELNAELVPLETLAYANYHVAQDFRRLAIRTILACLLSIPVLILAWAPLPDKPVTYGIVSVVLTTFIQATAWPIMSSSVRSIVYLHEADLAVLVSVSITTSYLFSLVAFAFEAAGKPFIENPFFETTALLVSLIYIGRLVQAATRKSASSAIRALQQLQSSKVLLVDQSAAGAVGNSGTTETPLDARLLHYGDIIRIRPDSRIPTDGMVIKGTSEIDESSATGESLPMHKAAGSAVIAGTLNLSGSLDVQVTQLIHENSLARVTGLVKVAQSSRSRFQDMADRFSAVLLPVAVVISVVAFVVWILVGKFTKNMSVSAAAVDALTYTLSIMIVSCPCAIGLAVPLVISSVMRKGLREGVLFRSSEALQVAHSIDVVAFDKTGTLSQGVFTIESREVLVSGVEKIIRPLVSTNNHPISKAIVPLLSSSPVAELEKVVSVPGKGIKATFAGYPLLGGNPKFTETSEAPLVLELAARGLTLFTVTLGGELVAVFGLADVARPDSANLVADLKARGKEVFILSGDNIGAVERFAKSISMDVKDVRAGCSPKEKAAFTEELQKGGKKVCFVGDGTNDGPALAQADLSLAIGSPSSSSSVAVAASGAIILESRNLRRSVLSALDLAAYARQHIIASLCWCVVYFVMALLLASGALVKVRIQPQWAGLGEVVSVLPVILIGFGVLLRRG
ncbi:E1-E2 ATPase-domain-containing protein [Flagelloscypha sp. PMI_526]|nr:E1-E2 ATPase-domain-containing protein [Flagelloscypha sp. PMI_526]